MAVETGLRRKLWWVGALYFVQGLPFGIVLENLPLYFRVHGVSLKEVGAMSLLTLPWSLKVFWAPLVDRVGQRRQWISGALVWMALALAAVPLLDPTVPGLLLWSLLFTFTLAAATQDIAIDAYTIELLDPGEEGVANGVRVSAYRVALIVAGGALVALAGYWGWKVVIWLASALLLVLAALVTATPRVDRGEDQAPPGFAALRAMLSRPGAWAVLTFVLIYKLGDASMGPMVRPFWLDRGLSLAEIGFVSTTLGVGASMVGAMVGGIATSRIGIFHALWALGLAQALSNLGYSLAAAWEVGPWGIYAASLIESFTGGLGTAAFLSFLMHVCDKKQAATQYALLSAIFGLSRTLIGAPSGFAAERLGYAEYFALTFALSLPAYALLPWVRGWCRDRPVPAFTD